MLELGNPDREKVREALHCQGWTIIRVGSLTINQLIQLCTDLIGESPLGYDGKEDCRGVNRIGCGQSRYLSDGKEAISLHSEEYHLAIPLRWLFLYCNQKAEIGGASWFVDFQTIAKRLDPGGEAFIRYRRLNDGWTDWLPLWNADRISFATPQINRDVEVRNLPGGMEKLLDACRNQTRETILETGDLIALDNARMLHGRANYSGERCFWRIAY